MTIEQMQMLLNVILMVKFEYINERTIPRTIIDVLNANIYIGFKRTRKRMDKV